jgi:hypothetical protein
VLPKDWSRAPTGDLKLDRNKGVVALRTPILLLFASDIGGLVDKYEYKYDKIF